MSGISAQYVDGLEFRIKELTAQVVALTKERDECKGGWEKLGETCEAHTKTIEQLAALAGQNEKMRHALTKASFDSLNMTLTDWDILKSVANLPNLATPVLNKYRADGMRMAAEIANEHVGVAWAISAIRARADELEKTNAL